MRLVIHKLKDISVEKKNHENFLKHKTNVHRIETLKIENFDIKDILKI
jgi:hypothetical protein